MTQDEIKLLSKWAVENSRYQLTDVEKEIIKKAIDEAQTINDLLAVAFTVATTN